MYERRGVCLLSVTDPELLAAVPDAGGEVCRLCESDSSASSADYVLWLYPRPGRPYTALCGACLALLDKFFRAFPGKR